MTRLRAVPVSPLPQPAAARRTGHFGRLSVTALLVSMLFAGPAAAFHSETLRADAPVGLTGEAREDLSYFLEDLVFLNAHGETGVSSASLQGIESSDTGAALTGAFHTGNTVVAAHAQAALINHHALTVDMTEMTRGIEHFWTTDIFMPTGVGLTVSDTQMLRADVTAAAVGMANTGPGVIENAGTLAVTADAEVQMQARSQATLRSRLALPDKDGMDSIWDGETFTLTYDLMTLTQNIGYYVVSAVGMAGAPSLGPVELRNSGTLVVSGGLTVTDKQTELEPVVEAQTGSIVNGAKKAEIVVRHVTGNKLPVMPSHTVGSFRVVGMQAGAVLDAEPSAQTANAEADPATEPATDLPDIAVLVQSVRLVNTGTIHAEAGRLTTLTVNGTVQTLAFGEDSQPAEVYGMLAQAAGNRTYVAVDNRGLITTTGGDFNHAVMARASGGGTVDIEAMTVRLSDAGKTLTDRPIAVAETDGTVTWAEGTLYVVPDVKTDGVVKPADYFTFYNPDGTVAVNPDFSQRTGFARIAGIDDMFAVTVAGGSLADQDFTVALDGRVAPGRVIGSEALAADDARMRRALRMTDERSVPEGFSVFAEPYAGAGSRTVAGIKADTETAGVFAGAAWASPEFALTAFGLWEWGRTDARGTISRTETQGWLLGLTGRMTRAWGDGHRWWAEALALGGRSSAETTLAMTNIASFAAVKPRTTQVSAGVRAGTELAVMPGHKVEPSLGLFWVHSQLDAFATDFGPALGRADYAAVSEDDVEATAQVKWRYSGVSEGGQRFSPYAVAGVTHRFKDDEPEMTVRYGDYSAISALDRKRTTGFVEAGITFAAGERFTLGLAAGAEAAEGERSVTVSGTVQYRF